MSFSPTKGLLESWYWARPAEMEETKREEEEEGAKDGNRGWRLVSRCLEKEQPSLSWQLREVSASVTEVTENFLGIMKISSTENERFAKVAKNVYVAANLECQLV